MSKSPRRWRTPLVGLIILAFITFYIVLAGTIFGAFATANWVAQVVVYSVVGVAWVFPMRWLIKWAASDPAAD
ncbi:MAG: DUF2842 domain-containing protein [Alphaproteobacteria bacterium]|nr:DUF2842 domain-containing protein [Alphaproteobacteria bacterium]